MGSASPAVSAARRSSSGGHRSGEPFDHGFQASCLPAGSVGSEPAFALPGNGAQFAEAVGPARSGQAVKAAPEGENCFLGPSLERPDILSELLQA